jgi:beta-barrel assembly-enhancing protease
MIFVLRCLSLALKRNLLSYQAIQKWRWAFLLMPFLLAVSPSVLSDDRFSPCDGKQQAVDISLQRIENEWPMRGSGDRVSQYVQKLGVRLAHFSVYGRNIPWRFSVVRNLAPNAFSIGGGYVFITDGAVNFVQNESELAAILAHELGHELAGHFCGASDLSNSGSLFDIFSDPETQQHQVGVGSMMLAIDPVKEQEADQIAISILQSGGYDPRAMLNVARRLPREDTLHPMDSQRLQSLESLLAKIPPTQAQDSEDFRTIKRTLANE